MKLAEMSVQTFVGTVASEAPAPGGGSAAALEGAIGVALTAMVACLTQGRKKYAAFEENAKKVEEEGKRLQRALLDVMERDTEVFRRVSEAFGMPKETAEQKAERSAAIQEGLKECTQTPLEMMELMDQALSLVESFRQAGFNDSSASDLGVAFLSLKAGIQSAWLNVLINISSIKDAAFAAEARRKGEALLSHALPLADAGYSRILEIVET